MTDIDVTVRIMKYEDLDSIIDIDAKVLGRARPDYWALKVELAEKRAMASLVAEADGKVVGFILGDASGWEYGVPESVGWIDTIGVLPEYQKKGVARALLEEMVSNLRKVGVEKIYTLVDLNDSRLIHFFTTNQFSPSQTINLERNL